MCPRQLGGLGLALTVIVSAAVASSIVDVTELDGPPERVAYEAPVYPAALEESRTSEDVQVTLVVDHEGKVAEIETVEATRPELAEAARAAVREWRFQPGLFEGEPTAYRVRVTVPFRPGETVGGIEPAPGADDGPTMAAPAVEYSVAPDYPVELVAEPRDGHAVVNVFVDAVGTPSDPVVEFATHPAFAAPAREAVLAWKFTPAGREGELLSTRTHVTVRFRKQDAAQAAARQAQDARRGQAGDFDVAPEVVFQVPLVYPFEALLNEERATVSLNLLISPEGQVVDIVPDPGARAEFATAAAACVACWRFNPAIKADQPVFARLKWQLVFTEQSSELQFDETTHELLAALRAGEFKSASPRELDRPVTFRERVRPEWIPGQPAVDGQAVIEVIIDRNGRPQLPRVITAPTPEAGYAAATAVLRWRFDPPRVRGKPAHVRVKVPFQITGRPPPEDAGEKSE